MSFFSSVDNTVLFLPSLIFECLCSFLAFEKAPEEADVLEDEVFDTGNDEVVFAEEGADLDLDLDLERDDE